MIPDNNEIRFEVSTRCNYSCIICPRDSFCRPLEIMSTEKFKSIFDKIISGTGQYNTITFSGFGEPLLDSGLEEKIKYARDNGFEVLILTNASLLTVDRFKKFDELGVKSIRVSFYGNSPKVYTQVHRPPNPDMFSMVRDNLVEIAKIKKNTQLLFTYNIISQVNDHEVQDWIKFWEPKADLVEVWKPHNWVDGKNYRKVQAEKMNTCGRPWKGPLQVQIDGTVNMCCFDYNGQLLLGDVNKQGLDEIFSSDAFKKIVRCHESGDFAGSGLICENCDQRNKIKTDVMVYNSKFDVSKRVGKVSTTYSDLSDDAK